MAYRADQNQTWPGRPAAASAAPAQDVARRILGRGWWARFTFNGITRYANGAYSPIGGGELNDGERPEPSCCSCAASASLPIRCSALAEELLQGHANVLGDLTKQRRRDITSLLDWNCGAAFA